jgi:hypothetical protein
MHHSLTHIGGCVTRRRTPIGDQLRDVLTSRRDESATWSVSMRVLAACSAMAPLAPPPVPAHLARELAHRRAT